MKKTAGILAVLLAAIMICSLLAGCAKDEPANTDTPSTNDTAENTGDTNGTGIDPESEKEPEETVVAPIDGLDTVAEEISSERLIMMSTRASKFLRSNYFGDTSLSWYKFYNACVRGEVDFTSDEAAEFINECLAFFEENGLDDEAAQANALISAAQARA